MGSGTLRVGFRSKPYGLQAQVGKFNYYGVPQNITTTASGGPPPATNPGPQRMFVGPIDSNSIMFAWWPPATMPAAYNDLHYNVYRDGTTPAFLLYGSNTVGGAGVVGSTGLGGGTGALIQTWYRDINLGNNEQHTYYVTAVVDGVETLPGPGLTLITLQGPTSGVTGAVPTTLPYPPIDPTTWPTPCNATPVLPVGGKVWTCTNTAFTDTPGPVTDNVGCTFMHAINNYNPGDVIVLTENSNAGAIYAATAGSQNGLSWPAKSNPLNKWTYIVSAQSLEYNSSGHLVPWSYHASKPTFQPFTITWTSATAGTLSAAWASKDGCYPGFAIVAATYAREYNNFFVTNGSTAVTLELPLLQTIASYTTTCGMIPLPGVTPCNTDIGNMAIVQSTSTANGTAVTMAASANKLRFIGVWFRPSPGLAETILTQYQLTISGTNQPSCDEIYFDRCMFGPQGSGNFPNTPTQFSFSRHGIGAACNHFLLHQSYAMGYSDNGGPIYNGHASATTDANFFVGFAGGPSCFQDTFTESATENTFFGGVGMDENNIPRDNVVQGCFYWKHPGWFRTGNNIGFAMKNLFEYKVMERGEVRNSTFVMMANSQMQGGQRGRCFVLTPRDQISAPGSWNITGKVDNGAGAAGNILTVTSITGYQPNLQPGDQIIDPGLNTNTVITAQLTGTAGLAGTYSIAPGNQLLASKSGIMQHASNTRCFPWARISDINIHDVDLWDVGSIGIIATSDYSVTACMKRVRMANVRCFASPLLTADRQLATPASNLNFTGIVPDVTLERITHVFNGLATGWMSTAPYFTGLYFAAVGNASIGGSPNPITNNKNDRITVRNCAFNVNYTNGGLIGGTGLSPNFGATTLDTGFSNYTWDRILNDKVPVTQFPTGFRSASGGYIGTTYTAAINTWAMANWAWGTGNIYSAPFNATDWDMTTGTYSTAATDGGAIGAFGTEVLLTTTAVSATVGVPFSQQLTISGGTPPYSCNIVQATPNAGMAVHHASGLTRGGILQYTPQTNETTQIIVRATDSLGGHAQGTVSATASASGALSITSPTTLPNGTVGGAYFYKLQAKGGSPPYKWSTTAQTAANTYSVNTAGWLYASTNTASTGPGDLITVSVTDSVNAAAVIQTVGVTVNTTLAVQGVNSVFNTVNLPSAAVRTKYQAQLYAAGGTGPYTWAVTTGALPAGLSLSTAGLITGIPGPYPGNAASFIVTVTDSASHTATATCAMGIRDWAGATREAWNTGQGFFVDRYGFLHDPNGITTRMRGADASTTIASNCTSQPIARSNACRFFEWGTGVGGTPQPTFAAHANSYLTNLVVPMPVIATVPDKGNTTTTNNSTNADLQACFTLWQNNFSAWSALQNQIMVNIANEWGGYVDANWSALYQAGVASMRAAGYLCPLVFDMCQGATQDEQGFVANGPPVLAADPQKNLIFGYHEYNYHSNLFAYISNITVGANAVITFNFAGATHPFVWPGWAYPLSPILAGNRGLIISGVTGTMGAIINGANVVVTALGGSTGAWTVTTTFNTTGTAYGGGGTAMDWGNVQASSARLAAYRLQGIRIGILEFGSEANVSLSGPLSRAERIAAYEANGLDWNIWQFDGGDGLQLTNVGTGTPYTGTPSQLTTSGLDTIWNPWYGLHALAVPIVGL